MPIARPGSGSVTQIYEGTDGGARRARGSRLAVTLVIVAVSAIFGGVGTALWVPEKEFEIPDYTNSDRARIRARWREAMEIVFNPRPGPGGKVAKVGFLFEYSLHPRDREEVDRRIASNWHSVRSRNLLELMSRTPAQLRNKDDLDDLADDLVDAMNDALFADGIAEIDRIHWQQIMVQ